MTMPPRLTSHRSAHLAIRAAEILNLLALALDSWTHVIPHSMFTSIAKWWLASCIILPAFVIAEAVWMRKHSSERPALWLDACAVTGWCVLILGMVVLKAGQFVV